MIPIHDAIAAGDLHRISAILEAAPDQLEARNCNDVQLDETPLHHAILSLQEDLQHDVVKLLLDKGADVNAVGTQDQTALHYVAQNQGGEDDAELARLLIEHGADLERKDRLGWTPLHWACRAAPRVAAVLLEHGAKVDLNCAIRLRDVESVRRILKKRVPLTDVAASPDELLEDAILARNREMFRLLLESKKRPNPLKLSRPNTLLFTAIGQAMSDCDSTFLQELLEHGAPVDVVNDFGTTPLKSIEIRRKVTPSQARVKQEIIRMLESHGAQE